MGLEEISSEILNSGKTFLRNLGDRVLQLSQENIVSRGIPDTGFLLGSGYINQLSDLEVEVGYSALYAVFVENGTDPHMPPVKPLIGWSRRKKGLNEKEALKTAWRIAKKIEREGTLPQPFFWPAIEQAKKEFKNKEVN